MRYVDWRTFSSFGYVFGMVSFIVGLYAYLYYETNLIGWIGLTFYPYRNYATLLIVTGIVLLIVGYVSEKQGRKKKITNKATTKNNP